MILLKKLTIFLRQFSHKIWYATLLHSTIRLHYARKSKFATRVHFCNSRIFLKKITWGQIIPYILVNVWCNVKAFVARSFQIGTVVKGGSCRNWFCTPCTVSRTTYTIMNPELVGRIWPNRPILQQVTEATVTHQWANIIGKLRWVTMGFESHCQAQGRMRGGRLHIRRSNINFQ